jgi:hypothetical protein
VQVARSERPAGPLLIRGFGVQVPGGAPVVTWDISRMTARPTAGANPSGSCMRSALDQVAGAQGLSGVRDWIVLSALIAEPGLEISAPRPASRKARGDRSLRGAPLRGRLVRSRLPTDQSRHAGS